MPRFGVWEYLAFLIAVLTIFSYVIISTSRNRATASRRSTQISVGSWVLIIVAMVAYHIAVRPVMENAGHFLLDRGLLFPAIVLALGVFALWVWLARRNARRRQQERADVRTLLLFVAILIAGQVLVEPRARSASQFLADRDLLLPAFVLCVGLGALWALYAYWNGSLREQDRTNAIKGRLTVWGDAICEHLIQTGQRMDAPRVQAALSHVDAWDQELCLDLLRGNAATGMSDEMIRTSLGEPDTVDNEDVSTSGIAYRWVYRIHGRGPMHIWFRDDKVVRIHR